jgi:hypothetical protein
MRKGAPQRFGMWLFVCVLVCSTLALAVEAKHSQYHSQKETSSYLSKATKMSEGRAPQLGLAQPLFLVTTQLTDLPAAWLPWPPEPTHPKIVFFHGSFQFRPPPSRG